MGGGVLEARLRICATCRYVLSIGYPKESEGWEEEVCFWGRMLIISSADRAKIGGVGDF